MKNGRKREVALVAGGIVLGVAITGSAAQAAEMLTAQRSTQKIYVDGQQIQMETYSISGSNYVKLHDIGKAASFSVIYDPLTNTVRINTTEPYADGSTAQSSHTVTLPTDGSKYIPQVGDRILCDDGTDYAITDVRRWELNISPLPSLPTATCDWSLFPTLELPQTEARHFTNGSGEVLFIRNLYETRRMQYTIYNALGREPSAWKNGKPLATVQLTIPADLDPYTASMWPWHDSDLEELVHSRPNSEYYNRSLGLLPQRRLPAHTLLCSVAVKRGRIMASMISRLYHDELHLSERDYPEDSRAAILLDSFKESEEWLKKMLDGKATARQRSACWSSSASTMTWTNWSAMKVSATVSSSEYGS